MKSRFANASSVARSSWRSLGGMLALIGFPIAAMGGCSEEPGTADNTTGVTGVSGVTSGGGGTSGTTDGSAAVTTTSEQTSVTTVTNTTSSSVTSSDTTGSTTDASGATTTTTTSTTSTTGGAGGSSSVTNTVDTTTTTTTDDGGMGGSTTTDTTGATTGGMEVTVEEVAGGLDGMVVYTPCGDQPTTDDCNGGGWYTNDGSQNNCQGGALDANIYHDIGGVAGTEYQVTFHFYGIAEPKNYGNGVTRDAGNGRPDLNGGDPIPWAEAQPNHQYPGSTYNTYEIRVENEMQNEVGVYYLNADTQEGHYTMIIDYEKTITLIGGGRVHVRVFDSNCRQIKNCGSSSGYPCQGKVRTVDGLDSVVPALPGHFDPPSLGVSNDHAGQWIVLDAIALQ